MITFKQYTLLSESIFTGVRVAVIGLTRFNPEEPTEGLPSTPPYGFWADRSGNYIVVAGFSSGGHLKAAKEMILAAYDAKEEAGELTDNEKTELDNALKRGYGALYDVLTNAGFMHVVLGGPTYYYVTINLTTSQLKFIKALEQEYGMQSQRSFEIF
jgi:hypothetical protein